MPAVSLRSVTKLYPTTRAGVRSVSLDVASGEHLVIVGPSGAGKTTVLRLIAGLETPDAGSVLFDGRDVTRDPPHTRHVALVAQRPALFPHRSVRRNFSASVEFRESRWWPFRTKHPDLDARVEEAARILGITHLLDRPPYDLSGGEQQRVALGRAWVDRAGVWLLDEPLAHLESTLKSQIRGQLHLLRGRAGATIIEVTHDPAEALALGPRVAVLADGAVVQVGPPQAVYDQPRSRAAALALGEPAMNVADGVVTVSAGRPVVQTADGWTVSLPERLAGSIAGRTVTFGVRPEHILAGAGGAGDGTCPLGAWTVARGDPRGLVCLLALVRPGLAWRAWWPRPEPPAEGALDLAVRQEHVHLFDATTGERIK
ncbi:MAG TPA: ABC transporter ATP-binding protein [Gemmataceae bacterium]|nr:ABC transporter ATP-binding protein [Gemmataceae bacterium]